jgi:hypothetical protein
VWRILNVGRLLDVFLISSWFWILILISVSVSVLVLVFIALWSQLVDSSVHIIHRWTRQLDAFFASRHSKFETRRSYLSYRTTDPYHRSGQSPHKMTHLTRYLQPPRYQHITSATHHQLRVPPLHHNHHHYDTNFMTRLRLYDHDPQLSYDHLRPLHLIMDFSLLGSRLNSFSFSSSLSFSSMYCLSILFRSYFDFNSYPVVCISFGSLSSSTPSTHPTHPTHGCYPTPSPSYPIFILPFHYRVYRFYFELTPLLLPHSPPPSFMYS